MSINQNEQNTIDCLKHALEDTQQTIRAYDTKAEILAVLLTLAVGLTNYSVFTGEISCMVKCFLTGSWIFASASIVLLGQTIHPKVNLHKIIHRGAFVPSDSYFMYDIASSPSNTVSVMAQKALSTNWIEELTYECMKLSVIRDRKHSAFIRALYVSGICLALILVTLVIRIYGS